MHDTFLLEHILTNISSCKLFQVRSVRNIELGPCLSLPPDFHCNFPDAYGSRIFTAGKYVDQYLRTEEKFSTCRKESISFDVSSSGIFDQIFVIVRGEFKKEPTVKFFGADTEARRRRPPPQVVRVGLEDNVSATHNIGFGYKYTSVTGDVQRYIPEYFIALVPSSLIAIER